MMIKRAPYRFIRPAMTLIAPANLLSMALACGATGTGYRHSPVATTAPRQHITTVSGMDEPGLPRPATAGKVFDEAEAAWSELREFKFDPAEDLQKQVVNLADRVEALYDLYKPLFDDDDSELTLVVGLRRANALEFAGDQLTDLLLPRAETNWLLPEVIAVLRGQFKSLASEFYNESLRIYELGEAEFGLSLAASAWLQENRRNLARVRNKLRLSSTNDSSPSRWERFHALNSSYQRICATNINGDNLEVEMARLEEDAKRLAEQLSMLLDAQDSELTASISFRVGQVAECFAMAVVNAGLPRHVTARGAKEIRAFRNELASLATPMLRVAGETYTVVLKTMLTDDFDHSKIEVEVKRALKNPHIQRSLKANVSAG